MIYPAVCAIHRLINWGLVFDVFPFRLEEHKLGLERERSIFSEENSILYDMITLFREGDAIYLVALLPYHRGQTTIPGNSCITRCKYSVGYVFCVPVGYEH